MYYCMEDAEGGVLMRTVVETFRSDPVRFDREFGEYLMEKKRDCMAPEKCTFFEDKSKRKKWATCTMKKDGC
jgi:hypothetical protein